MRAVITTILILIAESAFSQGIVTRNSRGYFSLSATGLIRTTTKISNFSDQDLLKETFMPGAGLTFNYTRIRRNGLTLSSGLGFQIVPISYKFTVSPENYNLSAEFDQPFVQRNSEFGVGFFHIPVNVGYTFKKRRAIEPSLLVGIDVFNLNSFSISNGFNAGDEDDNLTPIFRMVVRSPHSGAPKAWITYNFVGKVTRSVGTKNQLSAGIIAKISSKTIYEGLYEFYFENGTQSGSYTDKGSVVGMQIGYAF